LTRLPRLEHDRLLRNRLRRRIPHRAMLPDGREAKDVLPAKADTGVERDRREKREAAGWEVWGNEAVDLVPGRHESIVRAMTPAKVEE
jgi:hypothetical protein